MIKIPFSILCVFFVLLSCRRDDFSEVRPHEPVAQFSENGFWVVNEGLFGFGNGEISFIDPMKNEVYNGVFASANSFSPGDIPFDLYVDNQSVLLTVNNSGRLWILQREDFKVRFHIQPIISPRHIEKISGDYFAVSSFANDSLYFIDLRSGSPVVVSMFTGKSTESLLMAGNVLYAANWSAYGGSYNNSTIQIIDPHGRNVLGHIQVGKEPNSMAVDKDGKLWVLCSGGFMNEEIPRLCRISLLSHQVEKEFLFPSQNMSPFSLSIDQKGETLYFINEHIYSMNIYDSGLPVEPLILSDSENFYMLGAGLYADTIIATDAGNYQVPGKVILFDNNGNALNSFGAAIIPGCLRRNL